MHTNEVLWQSDNMTALDQIAAQLKKNIFSHATLFSGSDVAGKETAIALAAQHFLGIGYIVSSDFFQITERPISIDIVATIKNRAAQTPIQTSKKLFIIRSIDQLTRDAAPGLLKILEDPGEHNIYIATTERIRMLLPTIRSRFSEIRFINTIPANTDIIAIKKMSYHQRFAEIPKLLAAGTLDSFIRSALIETRNALRTHIATATLPHTHQHIASLKQLIAVQEIVTDPTVNKRLVGEYIMMLL